VIVVCC